jgi:hypothetical protein
MPELASRQAVGRIALTNAIIERSLVRLGCVRNKATQPSMGLNALHEGTWRETSVSALLRLLEYLHSEPNTEPRRLVHFRNLAENAADFPGER